MGGAFLHKKSLLDRFKDDYAMTDPIKARRAERSWGNPIVRHKREKGIQDWAKSFAGKRHYRKLMRFNAMRSEAYTEKTAWAYLEELEKLEGEDSRMEATEKVLRAVGCEPGTEGRWYGKDGDEVDIIDVLDNTEWAFAQKVCGQLQESKKSEGSYRVKIGWKNAYDQDCDLNLIVSAPDEDIAGERGIAYVNGHIPHPRDRHVVSVRPYVEEGKESKKSEGRFTEIKAAIKANDFAKARAICDKQQGSVANVVLASVNTYQQMEETTGIKKAQKIAKIQQAHEEATQLEMPTLQMNLPIIATIVTLGTLTALFGTVLGMIGSFQALAQGGGGDSLALSMGISEALVNTASGIATSWVAVVAYNTYTNKIDKLTYALDEVGYTIAQTYDSNHADEA